MRTTNGVLDGDFLSPSNTTSVPHKFITIYLLYTVFLKLNISIYRLFRNYLIFFYGFVPCIKTNFSRITMCLRCLFLFLKKAECIQKVVESFNRLNVISLKRIVTFDFLSYDIETGNVCYFYQPLDANEIL